MRVKSLQQVIDSQSERIAAMAADSALAALGHHDESTGQGEGVWGWVKIRTPHRAGHLANQDTLSQECPDCHDLRKVHLYQLLTFVLPRADSLLARRETEATPPTHRPHPQHTVYPD